MPAGQHRQGRADADAVVGAQGGALGPHQVAVPHQPDGIPGEVVAGAFVLLADHVHVGLQRRRGAALPARGGGLADEHVAHRVLLHLAAQAGLLGHPGGGRGLGLGPPGDLDSSMK